MARPLAQVGGCGAGKRAWMTTHTTEVGWTRTLSDLGSTKEGVTDGSCVSGPFLGQGAPKGQIRT